MAVRDVGQVNETLAFRPLVLVYYAVLPQNVVKLVELLGDMVQRWVSTSPNACKSSDALPIQLP